MLTLNQGQTADTIILTLTEKVTLTAPYFMFVFTHAATKQTVSFNRTYGDDETNDRERYNQFEVNTATEFAGKPTGQWLYEIFESEDGITPANLLENGKMNLIKSTGITYTGFTTQNTYTGYAN